MPNSTRVVTFRLDQSALDTLDFIATAHGLILRGHGRTGQPDRAKAFRLAIEAEKKKLEKSQKRSQSVLTTRE